MKPSLSKLSVVALTAATFSLPVAAANVLYSSVGDNPVKTISNCGSKCGGKCGGK